MRATGFALLLMAAVPLCGCAPSAVRLADADVVHVSRAALIEDPARLPGSGYLSTGQPNAALLDLIANAGYAAVVDLRGVDEDRGMDEQKEVEARGMGYVSLPTPDVASATPAQAHKLADILQDFDGPVLLHCFSGNRVGSLFAVAAQTEGESVDDAMAVGDRAGLTRWRSDIRQKLERLGK